MKKLLISMVCLMMMHMVSGQQTHWQPATGYADNATLSLVLYVDNAEQFMDYVEIGAFCNGQCRGAEFPYEIEGQVVYFLTVVGVSGDQITFRLWDHNADAELEYDCATTYTFVNNDVLGEYPDWYRLDFNSHQDTYEIAATPNPAEGGTVSGAGTYPEGAACTLTATANEGWAFVNWTENGEVVSTEPVYGFTVTGPRTFVAHFEKATVTQTVTLAEGWNWFSSFIDLGDPVALLDMLKEALGENGVEIQSYDDNTEYYDGEWFGGLDESGITNDKTFLILVSNDCTFELEGPVVDPTTVSITLHNGWNWIGFPFDHEVEIAVAFADFNAEEGDVIQTSTDQTEFDGDEWFGGIETLLPGQGVMYYSNSETPKVLVFHIDGRSPQRKAGTR